jgi:hypothetical protein
LWVIENCRKGVDGNLLENSTDKRYLDVNQTGKQLDEDQKKIEKIFF